MTQPAEVNAEILPKHIAIIMDGNGRWAQKRSMLRTMGHKTGVESVQNIVKACRDIGIEVLTLYAFSTENWNRPALEVKTLMSLLKSYLNKEIHNLIKNDIKLRAIGQIEKLPKDVYRVLIDTIDKTASNQGLVLNLALSYGSRTEITETVKHLCEQCLSGELKISDISEQLISDSLSTSSLRDPDLIIRTGGESRLSNFLLWQASYAEIYITETHWPDFRKQNLLDAISDFQKRQRRFGRTGDQIQN